MNFEDLKNPELQEKLRACNTGEELAALAEAEGIELSDNQIEAVSGGRDWDDPCNTERCSNYMPI